MNVVDKMVTQPINIEPSHQHAMQLLASYVKDTKIKPGRRSFFQYRDLGVENASGGRMRANISSSIEGMVDQTGWHYHECEMQFVYIMQGKVVIEFEDGTEASFGPGDAMFIPGGTKHNEVYVSEDKISLEVCLPAQMGTVPCDRPAHLPTHLKKTSNTP
jgi:uncharacterized RmlC-like cupin family protein